MRFFESGRRGQVKDTVLTVGTRHKKLTKPIRLWIRRERARLAS
jgi:hypothetical protein